MIDIDFDNINEESVYKAFHVDGNESEALNDSYLELFELIGRDAMLKLFKYFRGDGSCQAGSRPARACQDRKSRGIYSKVHRRNAE